MEILYSLPYVGQVLWPVSALLSFTFLTGLETVCVHLNIKMFECFLFFFPQDEAGDSPCSSHHQHGLVFRDFFPGIDLRNSLA